MSGPTLTLDTILSAADFFTTKWSYGIESNKAGRVFRYLTCRLYDAGRGNLVNASLKLAQTTLAYKLSISRQWVGTLVSRLAETGWLLHESEKLPDGTNGSSVWRIGRQFKRLLVMLQKSTQRKSSIQKPAKRKWYFSPLSAKEKKIKEILDKEQQLPSPEMLERIPLLKRWLGRGT